MQKKNKRQKPINTYAKYSSLAFQMMITIALFSLGGFKLDKHLNLTYPIFTIILSTIGIITAIYYAIKDFIKSDTKHKKDDNNK